MDSQESAARSGGGPTRAPEALGGGIDAEIARVIEKAQREGLRLTGEGGLLSDMIKQAVEAAMAAEMTDNLGSCATRRWWTQASRHSAGFCATSVG